MKEAIINYYLEANAAIVFSVLVYLIFFGKEQDFRFKRIYLVSLLTLSLLIPFIQIDNQPYAVPSVTQYLQAYVLPEVLIQASGSSLSTTTFYAEDGYFTFWNILKAIYLVVAALLLAQFIFRLAKLLFVLKNSPVSAHKGRYKIIETTKPVANFSFFHYIYIGQADRLSPQEKNHIINHEMAHAASYHSADLLFVELLKIVFWFNPLVHVSKNVLTAIQEFEADHQAVANHNSDEYCHTLAKSTLVSANMMLAPHFNQSLTLKRIAMIKSAKQRMKVWKLAFILPVIASGLTLVACQDQAMKEVVENNKTLSQVNESQYPADVQAEIKRLRKNQPNAKFTYIEGEQEEVVAMFEKYKDTQIPLATFVDKNRGTTGVLLQDVSSHADKMKSSDNVYTVVEEAASPVGGFGTFMKYIASNLKYPADARLANIQGKVFVQFVVQEDGSISNVEILKGLSESCDEEARRVIAAAPRWNPGKQKGIVVKQRMSIPISFKLGEEAGTSSSSRSSAEAAKLGS